MMNHVVNLIKWTVS